MITVQDIHKSFGPVEVIKGMSFDVARGEVVCIIGPSGSGKSTVLRCVNGLESHDQGHISIDGQTVNPSDRSITGIRTQVSMVFQRFNLFPHRTALENVMEGPVFVKGIPKAEARERAHAILEKVGLGPRVDYRPGQLSGGQQQRVAIARALIQDPAVLLADEPVASLDPVSSAGVIELLTSISEERDLTVVCSLHQVEIALDFAHRVVGLRAGRVVLDRTAAEMTREDAYGIYSAVAAPVAVDGRG